MNNFLIEKQKQKLMLDFARDVPIKDFNKAMKLLDKKEFEKALILLKRVLRAREFKEAYLNIGVAYKGLNNLEKCRENFLKALDPLMPYSNGTFDNKPWPMAANNLGLSYFAEEKDDEALKWFNVAKESDPNNNDARWNTSLVLLRKYCSNKYEDLDKAWGLYTYRFSRSSPTKLHNDREDAIIWDFKSKGKSIAIMMEQGYGDAFMFGRYLSHVEKYFDDIWVQCTTDIESIFSKYNVCQSVKDAPITHMMPMCSLGRMMPYIPDGEWLADRYKPKLLGSRPEILCIWGGNKEHVNSKNRDAQAVMFNRFSKYGNLHTVEKRAGYAHMPIYDWDTTIKYLENIDIVITIDSSMSHLCGSLGKPCIVLMPLVDGDFRWGDKSMELDNKWYKSVKVIRNPRDWVTTMNAAESYLSEVLTTSKTGDTIKL